jgi:hypothetical protein
MAAGDVLFAATAESPLNVTRVTAASFASLLSSASAASAFANAASGAALCLLVVSSQGHLIVGSRDLCGLVRHVLS